MNKSGVTTANIVRSSVLDNVIGNRNGNTVAVSVEQLGTLLASSGPLASALGVLGKATFTELQAYAGTAEIGHVYADADVAKNGIYIMINGEWMFQRPFPDTAAYLTETIQSTANSLIAFTADSVSPGRVVIFIMVPLFSNTGELSLSVNGEASKPVYNINGDTLMAGEWSSGRVKLFCDRGEFYQLLQDPDVEALAFASYDNALSAQSSSDNSIAAQRATELALHNTQALAVDVKNSKDIVISVQNDVHSVANAIGPVKWYDTHGLAVADFANIPADQVVGILTDETQAGLRSLYRKEGALIFKTVLDSDGIQAVNASRLGADPTGVKDSKAAFIAAAQLAVAMGSKIITVRPGLYRCPGLTVDDILDCYLVGDGIKFVQGTVQATVTGIYPFTLEEWSRRGNAEAATAPTRGVVGIELDDALAIHWRDVFPLFKEMGVTFGVVWPVENGAIWIKEAYRHGFEIIAHGLQNEKYHLLTQAEIEANANTMLDAVEGVTGHRDNVAFVYPQHSRNEQSDEVLRRYFSRGRGGASSTVYPYNAGHGWLISANPAGTEYSGGELSDRFKYWLQQLAATNGRALIYLHYITMNDTTSLASLRKIIEYCQYLGIRIARPSDVVGNTQLISDPFFEKSFGERWATQSGNTMNTTLSTDEAYWGSQCLKGENTGGNQSLAIYPRPTTLWRIRNAQNGFSLYKFKIRRKHGAYQVFSHQSLTFTLQQYGINLASGGSGLSYGNASVGATLVDELGLRPAGANAGVTIPATDGWQVFERIVAIDSSVTEFLPGITSASMAGSPPLYYDDFTVEYLCSVPTLSFRVGLNGTDDVRIFAGLSRPGNVKATATPRGAVAGNVILSHSSSSMWHLRSTNATDTAEVDIVFTPSGLYGDLPFATV